MPLPRFQPGMSWNDIAAADMNALVDAVERLQSATSTGVNESDGAIFQPGSPVGPPPFAIAPAVVLAVPPEGATEKMMAIRRVKFYDGPSGSAVVWNGPVTTGWPDYGAKASDYRSLVWKPEIDDLESKPYPDDKTKFVKVQRVGTFNVVWRSASSAGIMRAIVRWLPTQTGFEQVIYVQKLEPNGAGGYVIVGDVFDVLVPAGMLSRNFYPMRFMPDTWSPAAPMIWLFEIDGIWTADQTTRFSLAPVDQNYPVDDCWIA